MSAAPLGIATELAERRRQIAARMTPAARARAFPYIYPPPHVAQLMDEAKRLAEENTRLKRDLAVAKAFVASTTIAGLPPEVSAVLTVVADVTGIPVAELRGPRKPVPIMQARHFAYHVMRLCHPKMTTGAMGRAFRRDHTTCIEGLRRAAEQIGSAPFAGWLADSRVQAILPKATT